MKHCFYSNKLLNKIKNSGLDKNVVDILLIEKAISWAKKYHEGQFRKSGEEYYSHVIEVSILVCDYSIKTNIVVASILHDIVEDTIVTIGMILDNFGWEIAKIVEGLTKYKADNRILSLEDTIRTMYESNNVDGILIKIIDRLHNLKNTTSLSDEKKLKIARESVKEILITCAFIQSVQLENLLHTICKDFLEEYDSNQNNASIKTLIDTIEYGESLIIPSPH